MRSNVVLPDPDGPSREKNSPSGIPRSIPATASTSSNVLRRPRNSMAGALSLVGFNGTPGETATLLIRLRAETYDVIVHSTTASRQNLSRSNAGLRTGGLDEHATVLPRTP